MQYWLLVLVPFFLSVFSTLVVRRLAEKNNFVYRPVAYRWNQRQVALGGGVAIVLSFSAMVVLLLETVPWSVLVPVWALFALGILDDRRGIAPYGKLIIQFLCAIWVVSSGFQFEFLPAPIGFIVSVLWVVGFTNSLNIIDNMDGLAGGITAISCLGFAALLIQTGAYLEATIALILMGTAMGFLVHNFFPARIFMGDAGSLPMGFLLSALALKVNYASSPLLSLSVVSFLLVVPLFDTTLVIISRTRVGRSIAMGGKDHSSHRLVRLGLSDWQAVSVLYAMSLAGILQAYLSLVVSVESFWISGIAGILGLVVLLVAMLRVPVYGNGEPLSAESKDLLVSQAS